MDTEATSGARRVDSTRAVHGRGSTTLPVRRVMAVIAHPDDESFGLGGVLSVLVEQGTSVSVLCFTHGESSTLGAEYADLATARRLELGAAAHVFGIDDLTLLLYPDGRLAEIPMDALSDHVLQLATGADALLVFDEGGVTGHPDHCAATNAALVAADILNLSVVAWALPQAVAERLNAEFDTSFVGRREDELDIAMEVHRTRQLEAIACHRSQIAGNVVLWRRLELLGNREWLRRLRPVSGWPLPADTGKCMSTPGCP